MEMLFGRCLGEIRQTSLKQHTQYEVTFPELNSESSPGSVITICQFFYRCQWGLTFSPVGPQQIRGSSVWELRPKSIPSEFASCSVVHQ